FDERADALSDRGGCTSCRAEGLHPHGYAPGSEDCSRSRRGLIGAWGGRCLGGRRADQADEAAPHRLCLHTRNLRTGNSSILAATPDGDVISGGPRLRIAPCATLSLRPGGRGEHAPLAFSAA